MISLDHSPVSDLHKTEQELKLRSPIFQEEFSAIGCSFSEYFQKSHIPMKTNTKFQNFDIFCIIDSLFPVNIFVMKCANENKITALANLLSWKYSSRDFQLQSDTTLEENQQCLC